MNSIQLIIGGDLFLGRRIEPIAINDPGALISNEVRDIFHAADYKVINLESPLTKAGEEHQLLKTGPNIKADPETIKVLEYLNIDLVTLANNHIYDYGNKGLMDTLDLCDKKNIETVGAGKNLKDASIYIIKEIKGVKIAFLNVAENEWCNADNERGGANPMNIIKNSRVLQEAKSKSDVIILIIHGGHEQYYYPSPRMVDQYRFYAEQGASLIVNHHSHCISGYEVYKKVPIFYGLGNFLFDSKTTFEGWYEGTLLSININPEEDISFTLVPYSQSKNKFEVKLLKDFELEEFEKRIKSISSVIADPVLLENEFKKFVQMKSNDALEKLSTSYFVDHSLFRKIIRKLKVEKVFLRKNQLKIILNYIRCEAHRDVTIMTLKNYLSKKGNNEII